MAANSSVHIHYVCTCTDQKTETSHMFLLLLALPKKLFKRREKKYYKIAFNILYENLNSLSMSILTFRGKRRRGWLSSDSCQKKTWQISCMIRSFSTSGVSLNFTSERLPPTLYGRSTALPVILHLSTVLDNVTVLVTIYNCFLCLSSVTSTDLWGEGLLCLFTTYPQCLA